MSTPGHCLPRGLGWQKQWLIESQSSALCLSVRVEWEVYTSSPAVRSATPNPCLTPDCCQRQETAKHLNLDAYSPSSLVHSGPHSNLHTYHNPQCTHALRLSNSRFTLPSLSLQAKPLSGSQSCVPTVAPETCLMGSKFIPCYALPGHLA